MLKKDETHGRTWCQNVLLKNKTFQHFLSKESNCSCCFDFCEESEE